uniref:Tetraspanin n=2 Tax=Scolopacidae TaxID=8917 RepID=A0A8C3K0W9_9CHAR
MGFGGHTGFGALWGVGDALGILGGCELDGVTPVSHRGLVVSRALLSPLQGQTLPCPLRHGVPMGVLSCMKYLMFIFNVLVFAGGTCLAGLGVWVAVDPAGFQDIVATKAALSAGAYLLLAVGIALALLGFLGCCGALRRSRPLLLVVREGRRVGRGLAPSLVPQCSPVAPIPQIQPEVFLSELRRNYHGDEGAEVFSTAWNTLMVTFSCCGVLGPEDFGNGSLFQELHPGMPWPRACCARDGLLTSSLRPSSLSLSPSPQGCFSTFGRTLQNYISLPGTCSLAVLGIEVLSRDRGGQEGMGQMGISLNFTELLMLEGTIEII